MRRPAFLGAIVTLALVVGTAMIATAVVMQPPTLTPATGDADAVRRFYAAVNEVIASGDTSLIHHIVAPHFVERAAMPGEGSGRSGLEAYLATLHDIDPQLRLAPEVVAAAGDLAVTRVTVQWGRGAPRFTRAIVDPPLSWGPVDVFRIADGMIAERWSHTDGTALVRPLGQDSQDLSAPAPRVVTIDRFTLAAGAQWSAHATGPHLLWVEEGALSVHIREGRSSLPEPAPAHPIAPLSAGQSLVMPAGAAFAMTNVGKGATRVVVVAMTVPQAPGGAPVQELLPPDVSGTRLAGGMAADVGIGPTVLTLEQMNLARGTQLSLASTEGPILIAVDGGQLSLVASEPAWIWTGGEGIHRRGREAVLAPGNGALQSGGGVMALRNVGDDPVVALVLTLRPV